MAWLGQTKNPSTFANQSKSGAAVVGDIPLDSPLFAGLDFDDVVPGSAGKTLGELAFDDIIVLIAWQNQAKSA